MNGYRLLPVFVLVFASSAHGRGLLIPVEPDLPPLAVQIRIVSRPTSSAGSTSTASRLRVLCDSVAAVLRALRASVLCALCGKTFIESARQVW